MLVKRYMYRKVSVSIVRNECRFTMDCVMLQLVRYAVKSVVYIFQNSFFSSGVGETPHEYVIV